MGTDTETTAPPPPAKPEPTVSNVPSNSQNLQSLATEFLRTNFGEDVLSAVEEIQQQNRYVNFETNNLENVCEILSKDNRFITDLLREPRFRGTERAELLSRVRVLIRQMRVIGTEQSPVYINPPTQSYDCTDATPVDNSIPSKVDHPSEAGTSAAVAASQSDATIPADSAAIDIDSTSPTSQDNDDQYISDNDYSEFDLDYSDLD